MSAASIREIAKTNEAKMASHVSLGYFKDIPDQKAMVILTCMDTRADPRDFWTFGPAAIVRNVGGVASEDALRSIRFLSGVMSDMRNTVGAVAVVHHTDCTLREYPEEEVVAGLTKQAKLDEETAGKLKEKKFGSWKHSLTLEETVWKDMKIIKEDPFLPQELEVVGYTYDVITGKTTEVGQL